MNLLLDIGGTNMRVAISEDAKTILNTKIVPTPQKFDEAMATLKAVAEELSQGKKIDAVAGGIAGPFNFERTVLVNAPHLRDWVNKPLTQRISNLFNTPSVFLENDSALAGLGEAIFGAGKDYKIVAYLGIGTGVGGTRIAGGGLDQTYAGQEPGHMIIHANKTLESYVSGTAIMQLKGTMATNVEDSYFWNEVEDYLVMGINNLVVTWSPNLIVIGGTIGQIPHISVDRLSLKLHRTVSIFPQLPKIVKGKLIDTAGLYGALALVNQKTNQGR